MTNKRVTVFEVGPRDGLQNQPKPIATADKIRLIDALSQTGLQKIEVASFVSPKWVPQMADTPAVLARLPHVAGMQYDVLVPNMRGLDSASRAGMDEIAIFRTALDDQAVQQLYHNSRSNRR